MNHPRPYGQKGTALLLAIGVLFMVAMVALELFESSNRSMWTGELAKRELIREIEVRSALARFRDMLAGHARKKSYGTLNDPWARITKVPAVTSETDMTVVARVHDLSGLFPVNFLIDAKGGENATLVEAFRRLLALPRFAITPERQMIMVDSLLDWLDKDSIPRKNGAETPYYQQHGTSYICADRPVAHISELARIRGFSPDTLAADQQHTAFISLLTVDAVEGKININTAPMAILRSLSQNMTEEMAQEMALFREEIKNISALAKPDWYTQVSGWPPGKTLNAPTLTLRSSVFTAHFTASDGNGKTTLTAIIKINSDGLPIISSQVLY